MIQVLVELPEDVAQRFGTTPELAARSLLENAAVEGYRSHLLSRGQVREMLNMTWQETENFLAQHQCFRHYSVADLDDDAKTLAGLAAR